VQSGNISMKLVQRLAGAEVLGPVLMGLSQPVNALNYYSSVSEIVNMVTITAMMCDAAPAREMARPEVVTEAPITVFV
jgi:phosphotransacetylase